MARTSEQEGGKANTRKRKLNLIYFVDSARTKSLAIPLLQLKILGAMLFLLVAWSIASTAAIGWLLVEKTDLAHRLQASLATVFDYESRYDGVYDIAYPAEHRKHPGSMASSAPSSPSENPQLALKSPAHQYDAESMATDRPQASGTPPPGSASESGGAYASASRPSIQNEKNTYDQRLASASGAVAPGREAPTTTTVTASTGPSTVPTGGGAQPQSISSRGDQTKAHPTAVVPNPEQSATAPGTPAGTAPTAGSSTKKDFESIISVTNPVLEPKGGELELRFDLTNRSSKARAEGYLWAVAEFKTDEGKTIYVGAPTGIDVNERGEPRNPRLSASFGIRHFKRKSFTFPYAKGRTGTFTAIRISVMDKTGADRTTYNVPIDIRVPKRS